MISAEILLSYLWSTIMFTVHIDAYDKQLCDAITQNDKPIEFVSSIF